MLEQIGSVVSTPYSLSWVPEDFLQQQGIAPWTDLPIWIPGDALMAVNINRAISAGLTFRRLSVTAEDTLEWDRTRPAEQRENRRFGMSREREAEVLAAWHNTPR